MKIVCDTREQKPYSFQKYGVDTIRQALPAGDYSIDGFEDHIAIERKSLDDLVGCLMGSNRDRFERELVKSGSYERFAVIVEAEVGDVSNGRYQSKMKPHSVFQSVMAFYIRYGVPFFFAGSRAGGEYLTHSILSKYIYEIEKRFKKIAS